MTDEVPLHSRRGADCSDIIHQSTKPSPTLGGLAVDPIQERTSCQIVLEKGQPVLTYVSLCESVLTYVALGSCSIICLVVHNGFVDIRT